MCFLYKPGAFCCPYPTCEGTKAEQLKDLQVSMVSAVFHLSGIKTQVRYKPPHFNHCLVHRHPFESTPKFGKSSRGWQLVESWPVERTCKEMQSRPKSKNRERGFLVICKTSRMQHVLWHVFCLQSSP